MCTSVPRYFTAILLIVLLIMVPVHAGTTLRLDISLADDQLQETPNSVTAYLLDSVSSTQPIAVQTYYEGDWQLVQKNSSRLLRLAMDMELAAIDEASLWFMDDWF